MSGKCNEADCNYPSCVCWSTKNRFSHARVIALEEALKLAREMMTANDLNLPHTFAVIDGVLSVRELT